MTVAIVVSLSLLGLAAAGCGGGAKSPALPARTLRLGVIGDSYSNGEGVGAAAAWPRTLVARLARDGGPRVRIVANPSVTGWTTQDAIHGELAKVRAAHPDVVTVQLGVNDWVQGIAPADFRAGLRRVLQAAAAMVGDPGRVVVVTIPDFGVTPVGLQFGGAAQITKGITAFNAIVAVEAHRAGMPVADVFGLSRAMADPALTAGDGLHPSARELGLWAALIEPIARRAWR